MLYEVITPELAIAYLHPVHPRPHCREDRRRERPARGPAVDYQAEDPAGGFAQKLGSPSAGLDAEA